MEKKVGVQSGKQEKNQIAHHDFYCPGTKFHHASITTLVIIAINLKSTTDFFLFLAS
jgi:hypothetical protein